MLKFSLGFYFTLQKSPSLSIPNTYYYCLLSLLSLQKIKVVKTSQIIEIIFVFMVGPGLMRLGRCLVRSNEDSVLLASRIPVARGSSY